MRRDPLSLIRIAVWAILSIAPTTAYAASNTLQMSLLYGDKAASAAPSACFVRRYDAAHLASHPHQNVRVIQLLAKRLGEGLDTGNELLIAVYFRGVKQRFDISGSCGPDASHPGTMTCGIDCDGGTFGLRQTVADTVLVDIPNGAHSAIYEAGDEKSPSQHGKARFGTDDNTFRLERAALKDCAGMSADDEADKP